MTNLLKYTGQAIRLCSLILAASVPGFGCLAASAADLADPKAIYQKYCSVCHGDQGNGDTRAAGSLNPRPRDFTSVDAIRDLTRDRMIKSVAEGRPGTAMIGHAKKLSAGQIESVVDYIRSNFMRFPVPQGPLKVTSAGGESTANRGQLVYKKHCSTCHGDDGNTSVWARSGLNPPPRDFTSALAHTELTYARMIQSVTQGRPGTAMQPFGKRLSRAEIADVVTYIRTSFMKVDIPSTTTAAIPQSSKGAAPAEPHQGAVALPPGHSTLGGAPPAPVDVSADMSLPFPNKLKGSAARGQAFFMNNCFSCHGVKGDGNGPRAYFITPRPRNFTSDQARQAYNRPRLYDAIAQGKRGTVMPAWAKVLSEQQIADVAEFVFQGYIKATFPVKVPEGSLADEKKKAS